MFRRCAHHFMVPIKAANRRRKKVVNAETQADRQTDRERERERERGIQVGITQVI